MGGNNIEKIYGELVKWVDECVSENKFMLIEKDIFDETTVEILACLPNLSEYAGIKGVHILIETDDHNKALDLYKVCEKNEILNVALYNKEMQDEIKEICNAWFEKHQIPIQFVGVMY